MQVLEVIINAISLSTCILAIQKTEHNATTDADDSTEFKCGIKDRNPLHPILYFLLRRLKPYVMGFRHHSETLSNKCTCDFLNTFILHISCLIYFSHWFHDEHMLTGASIFFF